MPPQSKLSAAAQKRLTNTPRFTIYQQLMRLETDAAYLARLDDATDDLRQRRHILDEVANITRRRMWLDFLIGNFYKGNVAKMETSLKQILRMGIYELTETDTPPYAVVNEMVELAKALVREKAGSLVNAILQAVSRNKENLPQPQTGVYVQDLAIRTSHPTWLVQRWIAQFGKEVTQQLLEANNSRPTHGIRVNVLKNDLEAFKSQLQANEIAFETSAFLPYMLRLPHLQSLIQTQFLENGTCAVQDEAAALVVHVLDPQPHDFVIDACAAPGGKALHAVMRMENKGRILAVDKYPNRLKLIEKAASQQGISIVENVAADFMEWATTYEEQADKVLLDVPCTGTGVLAKRADMRWKKTPAELNELVALQQQFLESAARLVKPNGILVYSTCSIEPEENAMQIHRFLEAHPEFEIAPLPNIAESLQKEGFYQILPHEHHTDGAFAARLRKRDS